MNDYRRIITFKNIKCNVKGCKNQIEPLEIIETILVTKTEFSIEYNREENGVKHFIKHYDRNKVIHQKLNMRYDLTKTVFVTCKHLIKCQAHKALNSIKQ